MDNELWIRIIILAGLILLSAFFSGTETAFSSANPIRLKSLAQQHHKSAERALKLVEKFDTVLITLLIGNNIVNIAAASLATVIFVENWGNAGVTISTAVMTVVVLIFGEITPKSLAKEIPEKYAMVVAPIMIFMIVILKPLSILFGFIKATMTKLFDFEKDDNITEEEILTMIDEAKEEGGINENERELIRSVIDFDEMTVEDMLTPRIDVIAVSLTASEAEIAHTYKDSGYSRLPVYDKDIDHIVGIINYKDFYQQVTTGEKKVTDILQSPLEVTEYMKAPNLLALLKDTKAHMAIVKDEFGGTLGVITMEDILEELVGEIWDEHDEIIEEIIQLDDETYQVKGQADLETFFETIGIKEEPEHATINGWVTAQMGKIPTKGDVFTYKHLHVTITEADEKRVLEIKVKVAPLEEAATT